jgi:hypothetical protein
MDNVGQIERKTQQRVVKLFRYTLGHSTETRAMSFAPVCGRWRVKKWPLHTGNGARFRLTCPKSRSPQKSNNVWNAQFGRNEPPNAKRPPINVRVVLDCGLVVGSA